MYKRGKYNYEFRLQCVEAILKAGQSVSAVSKEKGVDRANLRLWVGFYQQYGKSGLMPRGKRIYDVAFKLEVLESIDKEGLFLRGACFRFNIPSESVIINWRKAYESKGQSGLVPQPKGRPKNMSQPIKRKKKKSAKPLTREEELLIENEYLRAENELLKKLHALVQTDKKQKP